MFVLLGTCGLWAAEDLLRFFRDSAPEIFCSRCFVFHLFEEVQIKGEKLAECCPVSGRLVFIMLRRPEPLCLCCWWW